MPSSNKAATKRRIKAIDTFRGYIYIYILQSNCAHNVTYERNRI